MDALTHSRAMIAAATDSRPRSVRLAASPLRGFVAVAPEERRTELHGPAGSLRERLIGKALVFSSGVVVVWLIVAAINAVAVARGAP